MLKVQDEWLMSILDLAEEIGQAGQEIASGLCSIEERIRRLEKLSEALRERFHEEEPQ